MAITDVKLEARKPVIQYGLSTDSKSTPGSPAHGNRVPSYFYEIDTLDLYRFDGFSWVRIEAEGAALQGIPQIEVPLSNYVHKKAVNKFGEALDVDSLTPTDVWDGADGTTSTDIWVPPTAARNHLIASTSANDDGSPAGTGAHTVEIQGLDSSWDEQSETVTLNGTGSVGTANQYLRIFRMKVTACGSGGSNAGIITATALVDATVTAAIQTGENQTLMAIYTVPNGKRALITNYYASFSGSTPSTVTGNVKLLIADTQATGTPFQVKHKQGITGGDYFQHLFDPYYFVPEKSDIKIHMDDCSTNNSVLAAGFDLFLVDE